MAICKSATRYDSDSYYETVVNEETEDVMVRGVNNGTPVEYSLGEGGGSNILTVPVTVDYATMTATVGKTYQEMATAIEAGQLVLGDIVISNRPTTHSLSLISYDLENSDTNERVIGFTQFAPVLATTNAITGLYAIAITVNSDNTVAMKMATKQF